MYQDVKRSMNVVDTRTTLYGSSVPIRTISQTGKHQHVNYDILSEENCKSYHLTRNHLTNFRDVQDLFINQPQFFYSVPQAPYEYLGDYDVHGVRCLVFEKKFSHFNKEPDKEDEDLENAEYLHYFRPNTNGVASEFATVTHYYPADPDHWSDLSGHRQSRFIVPLKIEIRLFGEGARTNEIARLTINVANFISNIENYELFDLSTCEKQTDEHTSFLIKFDAPGQEAKRFLKYRKQIESSFRDISFVPWQR